MPDMVDRPDVVRDNPNVKKYHSTFPLKEVRMTTEQFGLIKPHFIIDDVASDDFEYRPEYKTRSYTLKAPLMQDVHRKLTYVKVDLSAILPLNFEKFFTNPVTGNDVPSNVGTNLAGGYSAIYSAVSGVLTKAFTDINGANNFTYTNLTYLLKALILGELFYSRGCLLSSLGCHLSRQFKATLSVSPNTEYDYDEFFDFVIGRVRSFLIANGNSALSVNVDGTTFLVGLQSLALGHISFRDFLNRIRTTSDWSLNGFASAISADFSLNFTFNGSFNANVPFNYGRVCAYQLACFEFMTNDKVDNIYSSELYIQYIGSLLRSAILAYSGPSSWPVQFTYNGVYYQYDYFSSAYLSYVFSFLSSTPGRLTQHNYLLQYLISLFSYNRSLRYKDYFVSSRVAPLAVGSVDVSVNNNAVSVVDISKNIQMQRFLNAVNHAGRRLSNYVKTFFGVDVAPDRHVPHFLAQIDELVYTAEVENTGAAQQIQANSVTAVFTSNSSNKQLHFYADLPGYVIGLTSYDIERAYCDTIDRSFFIQDRFDMFLPEMQFVGDQAIYAQELDSSDTRAFGTAFGYQYRDMQYKLLYAQADGGFVKYLPGYAYLFKPSIFSQDDNISPDFIRSHVSELDDYYLSLTGYSLASYFHFISIITNNVIAKRPMIANPKILE